MTVVGDAWVMNSTQIMEMERPARSPEQKNEEIRIPLDLTAWVSAPRLREWIMSTVATLDWTNAELMELLKRHPEFEPKALLNTLTFAYATGVFGADSTR